MKNNLGWQVYDDEQQQQTAGVKQHRAEAAAAVALCIHKYTYSYYDISRTARCDYYRKVTSYWGKQKKQVREPHTYLKLGSETTYVRARQFVHFDFGL